MPITIKFKGVGLDTDQILAGLVRKVEKLEHKIMVLEALVQLLEQEKKEAMDHLFNVKIQTHPTTPITITSDTTTHIIQSGTSWEVGQSWTP